MYIHFLYFLFNWRGVKPSEEIYRKWILLYLTKKQKTKQKEQKYNTTSWIIASKTLEKLSLIAAAFYTFAQALVKFLETKIDVKILILLLLLQLRYIS